MRITPGTCRSLEPAPAFRRRGGDTHARDRISRCGGDFLATVTSERIDARHWRILPRCGACEARQEIVLANTQAALLQTRLEGQRATMAAELTRLERKRMATEVETFAVALRLDLIAVADFTR